MREGKAKRNILRISDKSSSSSLKADPFLRDKQPHDQTQDIMKMQKEMGNQGTLKMLELQEQDDKELLQNLSTPIKEKKTEANLSTKDRPLKQFPPKHGLLKDEDYPTKLGKLTLPTGVTHIGYDNKTVDKNSPKTNKEKAVLVTEERREDQRKEPLHSEQKKVYRSLSSSQTMGSQKHMSQQWENGAVTITDNLHKQTGKILQTTQNHIASEEKSGNLKQTLPCLEQGKEEQEKESLLQARNHLTISEKEKTSKAKNREQTKLDQNISLKSRIAAKKKTQKEELSKKIDSSLKNAKETTQKLKHEDFFGLLWRKKRRGTEETEEDHELNWRDFYQEQKDKKEEDG